AERGVDVIPVWNKSNREHNIIGSEPDSVRAAADCAVRKLHWEKPYHVDADHINFETVDRFLEPSDFYTIDVADWIGRPAQTNDIEAFVNRHTELLGPSKFRALRAKLKSTAISPPRLPESISRR